MKYDNIIFLDTETTGFDGRQGSHKLSDAIKAYYLEGRVYNTNKKTVSKCK